MYQHIEDAKAVLEETRKRLTRVYVLLFLFFIAFCTCMVLSLIAIFKTIEYTHSSQEKGSLVQVSEISTPISEKNEPLTLQQPSVEKIDTIQPLIARLEKLEQELNSVKQNFSDTLKVQYLKADPENPSLVEEEPLPDGSKNVYQYLTFPLDGIKEVVEVQTRDTEGRWHEIQDFEIREEKLFIQSSEFRIRFDELGGQTQQFVKLRKEFKIIYR